MNIEDEDAATKPDNTHCVEAEPIDETPDLREIEVATEGEGSSTLPQAEITRPMRLRRTVLRLVPKSRSLPH